MFNGTKTNTPGVGVTFAVKELLCLCGSKQWQECIGSLLFLPGCRPLLSDIMIFFCCVSRVASDPSLVNYATEAANVVFLLSHLSTNTQAWQLVHMIWRSELAEGCTLWLFYWIFPNILQPAGPNTAGLVRCESKRGSQTLKLSVSVSVAQMGRKQSELKPRSLWTPTCASDQTSLKATHCMLLWSSSDTQWNGLASAWIYNST